MTILEDKAVNDYISRADGIEGLFVWMGRNMPIRVKHVLEARQNRGAGKADAL